MIKYYIKTYGCAMNYADSDSIRNILNKYDTQEVKTHEDADTVFLVTCSVRQKAEDRISGWAYKELKGKRVILTGCMSVRYDRVSNIVDMKYEESLLKRFPWITDIINIKDIDSLPQILNLETKNCKEDFDNQGLINISHGCDNFCSYCIVPYTRGKLTNYPKERILSQVKSYINKGGKLVTLLGQNVNSWSDGEDTFVDLLKDIIDIEGDFWVSFLSSHPKDMSDELIELMCTDSKFLKSCNIAVQSGSDSILKLMNRGYTSERFKYICNKIKGFNKDFRITTDIIVGFPSETDKDFFSTVDLIKECDIDMVYVGKYSPREGTKSYLMDDDIDQNTKKSREEELKKIVNEIRDRKHKDLIGKEINVLKIDNSRGISQFNHEVIFDCKPKDGIEVYTVKDYNMKGLIVS